MNTALDFIRAHTRETVLPFLPELKLALGENMEALWKETDLFTGDPEGEPPFWAFAWAGGMGLARYILDNPEVVAGKRVLDFAAGSGLVGLAAAKAGAAKVYSCDIDPLACEAAQLNAEQNNVKLAPYTVSNLKSPPQKIDLILAGDVCYDHLMAHRVLAWLRICVGEAGIPVLIGDPGRGYMPKEAVRERATLTVPTLLDLEDLPERSVHILEITGYK
ncbi:MAG: methyltransferase [Bdellovibrionales bacterium]